MGTGITEDLPNPAVSEVQQREILAPALLVHPDGPVPTLEMPTRHGVMLTETLTLAAEIRKLFGGPDDKRKRVVLTTDAPIYVATNGNQGSGMYLGGSTTNPGQIEITYIGPIFIRIVADGTAHVGVLAEYWAD